MVDPGRSLCLFLVAMITLAISGANAYSQRIAILTPDKSVSDVRYADELAARLASSFRVVDSSQGETAFRSISVSNPFNMTIVEAKNMSAVIGCDHFVLLRTGTQRRESFSRPEYYESFAVIFVISGRTGQMSSWLLKKFEESDAAKANEMLLGSIDGTAAELERGIVAATNDDMRSAEKVNIEEVPAEGSPAALNLKPPIPYKRIKPEYTTTAFLYGVRATVEIEADIDADGKILRTRVVRWAGFGLDESVDKAVRAMNWRPATRNERPLPMRVLLRYNFTKVEKE